MLVHVLPQSWWNTWQFSGGSLVFFVDKQYRRKGVLSFGLDEMLKKIKPREEELLSHTLSPISELSVCGLASFPCTRTEASRQLHNLDEVHIW